MNVLFLSKNYASTFRTIIYNRYGTISIRFVKFGTHLAELFRKTQKWTLLTDDLCGGIMSTFQSRNWTQEYFSRNGYA